MIFLKKREGVVVVGGGATVIHFNTGKKKKKENACLAKLAQLTGSDGDDAPRGQMMKP